jgi:hypothetical protein
MKRVLLGVAFLLVAGGAAIAWLRVPHSAEESPPAYFEVRLAQVGELPPQLQAADPAGAIWARHYEENLPAKTARACGAERFAAIAKSEFFQAVQIPVALATRSLVQCMKSKGGGYLRFATPDRQER